MSSIPISISVEGKLHTLRLDSDLPVLPQIFSSLASKFSLSSPRLTFDDGEDLVTLTCEEELQEARKSIGTKLLIAVNGSAARRDSDSSIPDIDDAEIEDLYVESRSQVPHKSAAPDSSAQNSSAAAAAPANNEIELQEEPKVAILSSSHHAIQVSESIAVVSESGFSLSNSEISDGVGGYYSLGRLENSSEIPMNQPASEGMGNQELLLSTEEIQAIENTGIQDIRDGVEGLEFDRTEVEPERPSANCSPVRLAGIPIDNPSPFNVNSSSSVDSKSPDSPVESSAASLAPLISQFFSDSAVLSALDNPAVQQQILHGASFLTTVRLIADQNPGLNANPLVIRIRDESQAAAQRKTEEKYSAENSKPEQEKSSANNPSLIPNQRRGNSSNCWVKVEGKKLLLKLEKIRVKEFLSQAFMDVKGIFDDLFDGIDGKGNKSNNNNQVEGKSNNQNQNNEKSYADAVGKSGSKFSSSAPSAAGGQIPIPFDYRMPICQFPSELSVIRGMGFIDTPIQEGTIIELLNGSNGNVEKVIQWITEKDLL